MNQTGLAKKEAVPGWERTFYDEQMYGTQDFSSIQQTGEFKWLKLEIPHEDSNTWAAPLALIYVVGLN